MFYSIYPKLRAIYSFLPIDEEMESLIRAKGIADFNNRLKKMTFLQRFPLQNNDLEGHLKTIPFSLGKEVKKRISGSSVLFFDDYLRVYELMDIKEIIHGGKGFFSDELKGRKFKIEELNEYMQKGFWKDCWNRAYPKFQDKQSKIELEIPLDHCYYLLLLKGTKNLPAEEKYETNDFILTLINFKNRLWVYRLKNFYNLENFEIKRLLIPEGEVFKNMEEQKGIREASFLREFKSLCYQDFKFKMYTMRSILAFFFFLRIKINEILAIYRAKLFHLESERLEAMRGLLYVGS
jgi:hypothetical protein